eukprot:TRINITY_DN1552_c0_g1_i11.p2 TRINITY_DN1552_c0_g1~~TRINITY_DN1552_c0_g1_i11.p2  ORF type:complete len:172 (+),score=40.05 TRINITY_DN1552_c0_g1_i11:960-1475(+)
MNLFFSGSKTLKVDNIVGNCLPNLDMTCNERMLIKEWCGEVDFVQEAYEALKLHLSNDEKVTTDVNSFLTEVGHAGVESDYKIIKELQAKLSIVKSELSSKNEELEYYEENIKNCSMKKSLWEADIQPFDQTQKLSFAPIIQQVTNELQVEKERVAKWKEVTLPIIESRRV